MALHQLPLMTWQTHSGHPLSRTPVLACSDTAIDTKFSTFSWIAYSTHPLWQGKGIIPGLVEDIYSGQSEAFGIFMTLCFLSNYLSNYPDSYLKLPVITVYCNNQGVLDRIQKLHQAHTIQSHDTTADAYDIYIAIQTALCKLKPITIRFLHVKGHQDHNKPTKTLSIQDRLNIECNKHATEYLSIAQQIQLKPNPAIPQCYPHLVINNQVIVRKVQDSLHKCSVHARLPHLHAEETQLVIKRLQQCQLGPNDTSPLTIHTQ